MVISKQCPINNSLQVLNEMKKEKTPPVTFQYLTEPSQLGSFWVHIQVQSILGHIVSFFSLKKELNNLAFFGGQTMIAPQGRVCSFTS